MNQVRLAQLYALRAQVEALIAAEEAALPAVTGCPHPEEKRRDTTTSQGPRRFLCLQCNEEILGAA